MSVDAMRAPAAGQQSTGVVKDVQKSAQAGIGGSPSPLALSSSHLLMKHPAPGCLTLNNNNNTPITVGLRIVSGLSLHSMKASLKTSCECHGVAATAGSAPSVKQCPVTHQSTCNLTALWLTPEAFCESVQELCLAASKQHPPTESMSPAAERILGLCKSIFRVDSVLLHLRDGDTVFSRPGDAAFGEQQRRTACNKLAPPDGKAAVCEDPEGDARQVPSFSALLKPQGCALSGLLGVFMTRA